MKTLQIAPSILSFPLGAVVDAVREMGEAGADWIHLDVMDGQFVPPITFGDALVRSIRGATTVPFEAHLMTETPDAHFDAFIEAGCSRVIFHHEATDHSHRLARSLRERGVQAGVAINPGTPVEAVRPLLDAVDLVLVMTVDPGWGGQKFVEPCLRKVEQIREWAPEMAIQVDGGVDPVTLPLAAQSGATIAVVGSYLTGPEGISARMEALRAAR